MVAYQATDLFFRDSIYRLRSVFAKRGSSAQSCLKAASLYNTRLQTKWIILTKH